MIRIMLNPSNQYSNIGNDGISEASRMRELANNIAKRIKGNGFDTRITNADKSDNLQYVVEQENKYLPHLFISLHSNAGPENNAFGAESYYYAGDSIGLLLSKKLVSATADILNIPNRGVFKSGQAPEGGLYVVDNTRSSAILVETFFHTDDKEILSYKINTDKLANEYAWIIKQVAIKYWGVPTSVN